MKLEGWHLAIVIVLALLLFGAPRLPGLARSVGQSLRIFRSEVRQMKDENPAPAENVPYVAADPVAGVQVPGAPVAGSAIPGAPAPVPPLAVVPEPLPPVNPHGSSATG